MVLDTNVLLSALALSRGRFVELRLMWQTGQVVPIACKQTVQELIRVLSYSKFNIEPQRQDDLLTDYLPHIETVHLAPPMPLGTTLPQCRDPNDQVFLQLAAQGQAQVLVTGDRDLLSMDVPQNTHFNFRIINPQQFLAQYQH
jgi:uncharacterized protein